MLITTGRVNDGVIQVDTKVLPDGTAVTVLAHEGDETFELNATQEAELLAAIAEAEQGEIVSASEVLQLHTKQYYDGKRLSESAWQTLVEHLRNVGIS